MDKYQNNNNNNNILFYTELVKDEVDEKLHNRMESQMSPQMTHLTSIIGQGGLTDQQSPNMPLNPMPLNTMTLTPLSTNQNHGIHENLRRIDSMETTLEPLSRVRSHTWPANHVHHSDFQEQEDQSDVGGLKPQQGDPTTPNPGGANPGVLEAAGPTKKNTSRRNPWGNLSYADLIAKAISSSPESRATLSQVYDWMVQNIPYFKDKGDSNSSAGWKVSNFYYII